MTQALLSNEQKQILEEALNRELQKKQKRFMKKRLSHYCSPKLKAVFEKYPVEFSPVLYEIQFRCYFSFYLFLILKSQVKYMDWFDRPEYLRLSISQDLNINKIYRETKVCRNIIRRAYRELIKLGMIEETNYVRPTHKSCKSILVYNDHYIHSYSKEEGRVIFNTDIKFNFYNQKPKTL